MRNAAPLERPLFGLGGTHADAWPLPFVYAVCAAAVIYAALLVGGGKLLNDADTFWHIAAGRWIWAQGAVPTADIFSHTLPGAPWVAQEWLAEAIFAPVSDTFGWTGVVVLTALAGAAAFGLLVRALVRFMAPAPALLITAMSFLLAAPHLTARPHVLAMPFLVAWIAGLMIARAEHRVPSWWLLPVMLLWANLHGGFVIGLGVAGAMALEAVLAMPGPERRETATHWAAFLAAAALASLMTPQGIKGWLFPFHLMNLPFSLGFVQEWHSPDFSHFQPIEPWLFGLFALVYVARLKIPFVRLLMLAVLIAMAMLHARNSELLALLAPLVLAETAGPALGKAGFIREGARGVIVLTAVALMAGATFAAAMTGFAGDNPNIAPRGALDAAARAKLSGPVFNDYDFGGYLIFNGVPVFVDGRVDLYGDPFMRDYAKARDGDAKVLSALLDKYGVTWTLLVPSTQANATLDHMQGWRRVYADAGAVIHVRDR